MSAYEPSPVPCAGCGDLVPYRAKEAGPPEPGTCFGEYHGAPIGRRFVRTHWSRECVALARAKSGVKKATKVADAAVNL